MCFWQQLVVRNIESVLKQVLVVVNSGQCCGQEWSVLVVVNSGHCCGQQWSVLVVVNSGQCWLCSTVVIVVVVVSALSFL